MTRYHGTVLPCHLRGNHMLLARTETGELKRLADCREYSPVQVSKNYGYAKGKALEQSRFVFVKACQHCQANYEGIKTAKYCSESCKQKAKRARNNRGA